MFPPAPPPSFSDLVPARATTLSPEAPIRLSAECTEVWFGKLHSINTGAFFVAQIRIYIHYRVKAVIWNTHTRAHTHKDSNVRQKKTRTSVTTASTDSSINLLTPSSLAVSDCTKTVDMPRDLAVTRFLKESSNMAARASTQRARSVNQSVLTARPAQAFAVATLTHLQQHA